MRPPNPSGAYLRQLRKGRRLTLIQLEQLTGVSIPVLSRMERGERPIERTECAQLARVLDLTPYETWTLYSHAGFLPETPPAWDDASAHRAAHTLLSSLTVPALLSDAHGILLAWNRGLQATWAPPQDRPVHLFEGLFSAEIRARMGAQWRPYVVRAMRLFAMRAAAAPPQGNFMELLGRTAADDGNEMLEMWNEALAPISSAGGAEGDCAAAKGLTAQSGNGAAAEADGLMALPFEVAGPTGPIRFAISALVSPSPTTLQVHLLVPADGESSRRYGELAATFSGAELYYGITARARR